MTLLADPLYTKDDLVAYFKVHERTVRRWVETGVLPAVKVGGCLRFRAADIERLVERDHDRSLNKEPRR